MEALRNTEIYTIDDIYALPDGERAELIDGQIYCMAPPSRTHQKLSSYLHNAIFNYIKKSNGKCEVYAAPFAVFLNKDETNYVEPDISIICDSSKLDEKGCHGAPDWIIEIISPYNQRMDYGMKLFRYRMAGVREYWIVNPITKTVQTYFFEEDEYSEQFSFSQSVPVHIYGDFSINIAELLG